MSEPGQQGHDPDPSFRETAVDVAQVGKSAFADTFGGVWIDRTNRRVHVQLTVPSPATHGEFMRRVRHPEHVVFDKVARTAAELDALRRRIVADMPALSAKGIHVVAVGEVTDINKNAVSISDSDVTAADALYRLYGRDAIIVRTGITIRRLTGRQDPPPLLGGIQLEDGFHTCTLGFISARISGGTASYQALTAGHCFPLGGVVFHDILAPLLFPWVA